MRVLTLVALAVAFAVQAEASDVGVSVTIGQPGFYGQIEIGDFPKPQIIYPKPVIIAPGPPVMATPAPVYVRVPPGHEKHWKKYCHKYNACNRPVYFVRDKWYKEVYAPEYRARHGHGDKSRGEVRSDRRENRHAGRGPDRGPDRESGRGPDRGHDRGGERGPDRR